MKRKTAPSGAVFVLFYNGGMEIIFLGTDRESIAFSPKTRYTFEESLLGGT